MLTASFIFAKGMTEEVERTLWSHGLTGWDVLRKHPGPAAAAIGEARAKRLVQAVNEADGARQRGDASWFASNWPEKEVWRLWQGYCGDHERALIDIETTGRTPGFDQITVIGLSDGTSSRAFIADRPQPGDRPLADFLEAIRPFRLLVSFNGIGFDVPFIEKHFRALDFRFALPHIDLMHPARSLGLSGGLKDMEKALGIGRAADIADVRGHEAIALWGRWRQGDRAAYDRLISYCKADCANLLAFGDAVYRRKWERLFVPHARTIDLDTAMGEQLTLF